MNYRVRQAALDAISKSATAAAAPKNGAARPAADPDAPWDDPIPLDDAPPVEPFPVEVLPEPVRRFVEEVSWSMSSPPDLVAGPVLAVAAGAIGASRSIAITESHVQPCILWTAVIASPGAAKSSNQRAAVEPIFDVERENRRRWEAAVKLAEESKATTKPTLKRVLVSDITRETLTMLLAENPRGLLQSLDELASLVCGYNQYKKAGNDRQTYLSLWAGDPVSVDRRSHGGVPLCAPHPTLSLVGGLQPDVVRGLMGSPARGHEPVNDGFLDRFLPLWPAELPAVGERWRAVTEDARAGWRDAVRGLLALSQLKIGEDEYRPHLVRLDADARAAWQIFTDAIASETNSVEFPEHLKGSWSKLRAHCARLALVVHCLRFVAGEPVDELVADETSMTAAIRLVVYFQSHIRKLHAVMDADRRVPLARRLLRWVRDRETPTTQPRHILSSRDGYRALRGKLCPRPEAVDPVLDLLERNGYIRPVDQGDRPRNGRPPSQRYQVHPSVLGDDGVLSIPSVLSTVHNSGAPGNGTNDGDGVLSNMSVLSTVHDSGAPTDDPVGNQHRNSVDRGHYAQNGQNP